MLESDYKTDPFYRQNRGTKILGDCPECGAEDLIHQLHRFSPIVGDNQKLRCSDCETTWSGLETLRRENQHIMPVLIERGFSHTEDQFGIHRIEMVTDGEDIPHRQLVTQTINAATDAKFAHIKADFGYYVRGFHGSVQNYPLDIRYSLDNPNLNYWNDYLSTIDNDGAIAVFDFKRRLLEKMFQEPFCANGRSYKAGELIRPDSILQEDPSAVKVWLLDAIQMVGALPLKNKIGRLIQPIEDIALLNHVSQQYQQRKQPKK